MTESNFDFVNANSNLIRGKTEKAYLIKLPATNLFFWHPKSCSCISGKSNYLLTLSFTEDWVFEVFPYTKEKKKRKRKMNVETFKTYFKPMLGV